MASQARENAEALRDKLLERRSALTFELEIISASLEKVENFLAMLEEFSQSKPVEDLEMGHIQVRRRGGTKKGHPNTPKEIVAQEARSIIEAYNRPIPLAELYEALTRRGLRIEGRDPEVVLSTMLWRQKSQVVRLKKGGGYWLPEKPWLPAQYKPTREAIDLQKADAEAATSVADWLNSAVFRTIPKGS